MRRLSGFALDVCVGFEAAGESDVVLESQAVFAEVMPATGEPCPIWAECLREIGGQRADLIQMIGQIVGWAPVAIVVLGCVCDGDEFHVSHANCLQSQNLSLSFSRADIGLPPFQANF